jgi:hypothetical protein
MGETENKILEKLSEVADLNNEFHKSQAIDISNIKTDLASLKANYVTRDKALENRLLHIEKVLDGEDGTNGIISKVNILWRFIMYGGSGGGIVVGWHFLQEIIKQ